MYFRVFQRWWCISPPSLPPEPTCLGEQPYQGARIHTRIIGKPDPLLGQLSNPRKVAQIAVLC